MVDILQKKNKRTEAACFLGGLQFKFFKNNGLELCSLKNDLCVQLCRFFPVLITERVEDKK